MKRPGGPVQGLGDLRREGPFAMTWTVVEGPPRAVVLATDLSARCDRAMDRAAALAKAWGAALVAVHALEPAHETDRERHMPSWRRRDPVGIAEAQLRRDLTDIDVRVVVEKGEPAEIVLRAVATSRAGLIVAGVARNEALGRFGVGATVDRLAQQASAPILIVKERPRQPYGRILVAADFSESSKRALQTAIAFFPDVHLTVLNAFDAPSARPDDDADREGLRATALADGETFLARAGIFTAAQRRNVTLVAEPGDPADLVRQYAEDHGVDLVVVGIRGRPGLLDLLIGTAGRSILAAVPCDALVVPHGRDTSETNG